jgi:hypothetical protein
MTEAEWLAGCGPRIAGDPRPLQDLLKETRLSERKLRLFACHCLRQLGRAYASALTEAALETAERFADGLATLAELRAAQATSQNEGDGLGSSVAFDPAVYSASGVVHMGGNTIGRAAAGDPWPDEARFKAAYDEAVREWQRMCWRFLQEVTPPPLATPKGGGLSALIDLAMSPTGRVGVDRSWRTDTAVMLARQMYDAREFSAMPILADALQDAECNNDTILNHCRGPGPHVRGCWVVDLVLGKE